MKNLVIEILKKRTNITIPRFCKIGRDLWRRDPKTADGSPRDGKTPKTAERLEQTLKMSSFLKSESLSIISMSSKNI